jgi:hypothetical protein
MLPAWLEIFPRETVGSVIMSSQQANRAPFFHLNWISPGGIIQLFKFTKRDRTIGLLRGGNYED